MNATLNEGTIPTTTEHTVDVRTAKLADFADHIRWFADRAVQEHKDGWLTDWLSAQGHVSFRLIRELLHERDRLRRLLAEATEMSEERYK